MNSVLEIRREKIFIPAEMTSRDARHRHRYLRRRSCYEFGWGGGRKVEKGKVKGRLFTIYAP